MKILTYKGLLPSWRKIKEGKKDICFFLMNMPFFCHSSKMYRKLPPHHFSEITGKEIDCLYHVKSLRSGGVYHIDESLGVYRRGVGISSNGDAEFASPSLFLESASISIIDSLKDIVDIDLLNKAKAKKYMEISYQFGLAGDIFAMKVRIKKSKEKAYLGVKQSILSFLSILPDFICSFVLRLYSRLKGKG